MILTCVVTHNRLAYTQRCIGSLVALARPDDRIVVVDNASTDGTQEWLHSIGLPLIENHENRFAGAACNQGWDLGLATGDVAYLHRSDNDILYYPGWQEEVERAFTDEPTLALLGVLNLHEDRGLVLTNASGIEVVGAVGGNAVIPSRLYRDGLRWDEKPWAPGMNEDARMSVAARERGIVAQLNRTVADNMAFCRYDDFPDYYDRTAALRGLSDARHSV